MKNAIVTTAKSMLSSSKYQIKKHSPEILIVTGVIGVVTSTVLACKATLKAKDVVDDLRERLDEIKETKEEALAAEEVEEIDESIFKKATFATVASASWKLTKLYLPSVILGSLSIASIFASNNILRKRNACLAAAYAGLDKSFTEYRKRVADKWGEEAEKEIRYNMEKKKIEETEVDENGKEKKKTRTVGVADIGDFSDYAVYFNDSVFYRGDKSYDLYFLNAKAKWLNDKFRSKKWLTLSEVYEELGVKVTDRQEKASLVVGWKLEKNNEVGDNAVLFDIVESYREREDGEIEPCVIVDFNVDGDIFSRM